MKNITPAARRLGVHIHAFVFVLTMVLLAAINLWKGAPYWVLWVLLGWGMGLLTHWWFATGPGARKAALLS